MLKAKGLLFSAEMSHAPFPNVMSFPSVHAEGVDHSSSYMCMHVSILSVIEITIEIDNNLFCW